MDPSSPDLTKAEQSATQAGGEATPGEAPAQQASPAQASPAQASPAQASPAQAGPDQASANDSAVQAALKGSGWPRPELNRSYAGPFARMQASGNYEATWNWSAFLFGSIWYLYQGMWAKAILYFFMAGMIASLLTPLLGVAAPLVVWVGFGMIANHDLWLWRSRQTQWW